MKKTIKIAITVTIAVAIATTSFLVGINYANNNTEAHILVEIETREQKLVPIENKEVVLTQNLVPIKNKELTQKLVPASTTK